MFTFDPGFTSTASCASKITHIDGNQGKLLHRGYRIQELTDNGSYIELCYLLIYGELPSKDELKKFEETVVNEMMIHQEMIEFFKGFKESAHPMAIMTGVVGALSAFEKDIDVNCPKNREYVAIRLVAKMPTLAAISYRHARGLPIVYPRKDFNYI